MQTTFPSYTYYRLPHSPDKLTPFDSVVTPKNPAGSTLPKRNNQVDQSTHIHSLGSLGGARVASHVNNLPHRLLYWRDCRLSACLSASTAHSTAVTWEPEICFGKPMLISSGTLSCPPQLAGRNHELSRRNVARSTTLLMDSLHFRRICPVRPFRVETKLVQDIASGREKTQAWVS
ncbi:hypothetical protein BaRGS_00039793 [Batillaria attramentaria]|uniref:Uncharacterized protein n=1 Tax=Batillaria attramentaria TaxID=370345 RepID=A0ABD0J296_9CAEN